MKQPLISGLYEVAGFKGSCHEIAIRRDMLAYNASLLLNDVAFVFFQIIQIEKSLKNNEQILDNYRKIVNELNRRIGVGKSRKSEVLRTYGQLYAAEARIRSLRNELGRKRLEFTVLSGVPAESALTDTGDIPGPDISIDDIKKMIDNRHDIKASRGQVKLADTRMWEAIGGHFPSAYLGGSYRLYQDNPQTNREFYGSLGFEVPLFIGEVPGRAEEMWSLRRQAELNLAKNARNAEKEIRD
jgi:outer membrane protein TolC